MNNSVQSVPQGTNNVSSVLLSIYKAYTTDLYNINTSSHLDKFSASVTISESSSQSTSASHTAQNSETHTDNRTHSAQNLKTNLISQLKTLISTTRRTGGLLQLWKSVFSSFLSDFSSHPRHFTNDHTPQPTKEACDFYQTITPFFATSCPSTVDKEFVSLLIQCAWVGVDYEVFFSFPYENPISRLKLKTFFPFSQNLYKVDPFHYLFPELCDNSSPFDELGMLKVPTGVNITMKHIDVTLSLCIWFKALVPTHIQSIITTALATKPTYNLNNSPSNQLIDGSNHTNPSNTPPCTIFSVLTRLTTTPASIEIRNYMYNLLIQDNDILIKAELHAGFAMQFVPTLSQSIPSSIDTSLNQSNAQTTLNDDISSQNPLVIVNENFSPDLILSNLTQEQYCTATPFASSIYFYRFLYFITPSQLQQFIITQSGFLYFFSHFFQQQQEYCFYNRVPPDDFNDKVIEHTNINNNDDNINGIQHNQQPNAPKIHTPFQQLQFFLSDVVFCVIQRLLPPTFPDLISNTAPHFNTSNNINNINRNLLGSNALYNTPDSLSTQDTGDLVHYFINAYPIVPLLPHLPPQKSLLFLTVLFSLPLPKSSANYIHTNMLKQLLDIDSVSTDQTHTIYSMNQFNSSTEQVLLPQNTQNSTLLENINDDNNITIPVLAHLIPFSLSTYSRNMFLLQKITTLIINSAQSLIDCATNGVTNHDNVNLLSPLQIKMCLYQLLGNPTVNMKNCIDISSQMQKFKQEQLELYHKRNELRPLYIEHLEMQQFAQNNDNRNGHQEQQQANDASFDIFLPDEIKTLQYTYQIYGTIVNNDDDDDNVNSTSLLPTTTTITTNNNNNTPTSHTSPKNRKAVPIYTNHTETVKFDSTSFMNQFSMMNGDIYNAGMNTHKEHFVDVAFDKITTVFCELYYLYTFMKC